MALGTRFPVRFFAMAVATAFAAPSESVSASDLSINRRPYCSSEQMWYMDPSINEDAIDNWENRDWDELERFWYMPRTAKWERLEKCEGDSQATCYSRDHVKIDKTGLVLSATPEAGARVRIEKKVYSPWRSTSDMKTVLNTTLRLSMHVNFPPAESQPRARVKAAIYPLNTVFIVGLIRTGNSKHQLAIISPSHNVSVAVDVPCGSHITNRFHDLDLEWNTQWLRWYWDGRVVYERVHSVQLDTLVGSLALEFALSASTMKNDVFRIKRTCLSQPYEDNPTCRPLLDPDTNCRDHATVQPRLGANEGFLSLGQVNAYLHNVSVSTQFPSSFTRLETIGYSHENRSILALCVGACTTPSAPQVLFTAMHHAHNPTSMMNLIYTIDLLSLDFANGVLDVLTVLYSRQLWFIPLVNPDGYAINEQLRVWNWKSDEIGHRKNTRFGGCARPTGNGVNLNRNYDICSNQDERGGQSKPCEQNYQGTAPFSEPETRAIKEFVERKDSHFSTAVNYFSSGWFFNIPFSCEAKGKITDEIDLAIYNSWAREMASNIGINYGHHWQRDNSFTVNGEISDWMWGAHGIFAISAQIGQNFFGERLWAPVEDIPRFSSELYNSNLVAARLAGPIHGIKIVRIDRVPDSDKMKVGAELVNNGLSTMGTVELIASITLDGAEGSVSSASVSAEELGTLRNGTHSVNRTLTMPIGNVVHIFVRDELACKYTRVAVGASPSNSSALIFQQFQALDLPPCGVCATLGRNGSTLVSQPRCEFVQDLVSADALALEITTLDV
ncbi:hypothetical protein Poli38472_004700 [Pythium oligandrum]|uniref:Peptidase M14 domain-containing protein n=1 Tax=Pythium oligandrum TaxID=41045 RepID=A0A8K1CAC8_PYTOL|nr:hypothetical protein Poli38472_004700 [Pythium oligandrum]|eukprot:TMW59631.1 hypothetical protein Poli38472_004700 [Pythium oligandrum]